MPRKLLIHFFCLVLITIAAKGNAQTDTKEIQQRLQVALDSLHKANGFPGATFAAVLSTGETVRIATGIADSSNRLPMTPDHRMLSGSIGKTFFAAAVASLLDQGSLKLDDPISKYLSSEAWFDRLPNARNITIRMLMNHTTGIEEYYELGDFMQQLKQDPYRRWKPLELFSYIFDRKPLFEAGTRFGYSDTNYLILGYLVEKQTGRKMFDLAMQFAVKPNFLSLTEPSLKTQYRNLAVGYSRSYSNPFPFQGPMVQNERLVFSPEFEWTGGGFVSNAADLARWAKAYYQLKGVSAEVRKEMQQGVHANTGRDHLYALGMQIRPFDGGFSYGHSGWFPGYVSDCMYFPEIDLAVAIQFNTDDLKLLKGSTESYLRRLTSIIKEFR